MGASTPFGRIGFRNNINKRSSYMNTGTCSLIVALAWAGAGFGPNADEPGPDPALRRGGTVPKS